MRKQGVLHGMQGVYARPALFRLPYCHLLNHADLSDIVDDKGLGYRNH
jgi:hypothetical protein